MTNPNASIAMRYVRLLTDYCEREGLPPAELFHTLEINAQILEDREARLPYERFQNLLALASEALDDPCLGLRVGQGARPGYYGPYGFTLTTCTTGREVMERSIRYSALVTDACRNEILEDHGECVRYWRSNLPDHAAPGILAEQLNAAAWLTMARWVSAMPDFNPNWIAFRHARPDDLTEYEALFRCPLRFDAEENATSFDAEYLDRPLPQADTQVRQMMEAVCERLEKQYGTAIEPAWLSACKKAIIEAFGRSEPKVKLIAEAIQLSSTELQHRLAARDTHFRELVDELRRELAVSYLQDPSLMLIDIACLLGFSEQSAFQRAFKRWTGKTPRDYRMGVSHDSVSVPS